MAQTAVLLPGLLIGQRGHAPLGHEIGRVWGGAGGGQRACGRLGRCWSVMDAVDPCIGGRRSVLGRAAAAAAAAAPAAAAAVPVRTHRNAARKLAKTGLRREIADRKHFAVLGAPLSYKGCKRQRKLRSDDEQSEPYAAKPRVPACAVL